jgi:hypothetical protein
MNANQQARAKAKGRCQPRIKRIQMFFSAGKAHGLVGGTVRFLLLDEVDGLEDQHANPALGPLF